MFNLIRSSSAADNPATLRSPRRRLGLLLCSKCRRPEWDRSTLPVAVILKRLATALRVLADLGRRITCCFPTKKSANYRNLQDPNQVIFGVFPQPPWAPPAKKPAPAQKQPSKNAIKLRKGSFCRSNSLMGNFMRKIPRMASSSPDRTAQSEPLLRLRKKLSPCFCPQIFCLGSPHVSCCWEGRKIEGRKMGLTDPLPGCRRGNQLPNWQLQVHPFNGCSRWAMGSATR